MQQKLCLWLAVAVLFGALAAGNPFRVERAEQRAPPGPGTDLRPAGSVHFEATPALAVALNTPVPADASAAPLCPDLELRPLVVAVERNAHGELVWVLRDGSRHVRNPKHGAGQPLLIPVAK